MEVVIHCPDPLFFPFLLHFYFLTEHFKPFLQPPSYGCPQTQPTLICGTHVVLNRLRNRPHVGLSTSSILASCELPTFLMLGYLGNKWAWPKYILSGPTGAIHKSKPRKAILHDDDMKGFDSPIFFNLDITWTSHTDVGLQVQT